jgi:hypothetical protein
MRGKRPVWPKAAASPPANTWASLTHDDGTEEGNTPSNWRELIVLAVFAFWSRHDGQCKRRIAFPHARDMDSPGYAVALQDHAIASFVEEEDMASTLVRRDQFNITPQGIIHKPTDAAFTPHAGDPYSGTVRLGQLGNQLTSGEQYSPEDVQRMIKELWAEYIAANPELFKT